ncbi:MAG: hypothetical protein CSA21_04410 [Deltaproteobacteria bacterium]|nr:MAG: hypothetical protein CSA21_04410 [Deltaproteobacteria bacterium]
MDVQCNACNKVIDIPDSKVPQAASFSFTCPYCRERVRVEASEPSASDQTPVPEPPKESERVVEETSPVVEPDAIPPGTDVALIMVSHAGWCQGAEDFFRKQGYYLVLPESVAIASRKLTLQHHDVILIQDDEACKPLWDIIHSWRGLDRRERNVICLIEDAVSLMAEEAFVRGVNACLALQDEERKEELLTSCLKEYESTRMPWRKAAESEAVES